MRNIWIWHSILLYSDELNTGVSQAINEGLNLPVVFLFPLHEHWDCRDVLEEEMMPQYFSDLASCGHISSGLQWCAKYLLLRANRWHYRGGGSVKYLGCDVLVGEMDLEHVWLQVFYDDSRGCRRRRNKHHLLFSTTCNWCPSIFHGDRSFAVATLIYPVLYTSESRVMGDSLSLSLYIYIWYTSYRFYIWPGLMTSKVLWSLMKEKHLYFTAFFLSTILHYFLFIWIVIYVKCCI